jgi:hypothetical protein
LTTTYQTLNGGGIARNETLVYRIKSSTGLYEVRLDNFADSRIFIDAERIDQGYGAVVPTATTVRDSVTITANAGAVTVNGDASAILFTGTSSRVRVAVPAGQVLSTVVSSNTGVTVGVADGYEGALEVAVAAGTTGTVDLTVTFATPGAARLLAQANAGVAVTLGTLQFRMPTSGNRSMQIASATGGAVSASIGSVAPSSAGGAPAGIGLVSLSLNGAGTFQYVKSHNFTAQGQSQLCTIHDTTNNRWYQIQMEVGSAFDSNVFAGFEIL